MAATDERIAETFKRKVATTLAASIERSSLVPLYESLDDGCYYRQLLPEGRHRDCEGVAFREARAVVHVDYHPVCDGIPFQNPEEESLLSAVGIDATDYLFDNALIIWENCYKDDSYSSIRSGYDSYITIPCLATLRNLLIPSA